MLHAAWRHLLSLHAHSALPTRYIACQVVHRGVAERSGIRDGDLVTYIAGNRIPASPMSVGSLVDVIKCGQSKSRVAITFSHTVDLFVVKKQLFNNGYTLEQSPELPLLAHPVQTSCNFDHSMATPSLTMCCVNLRAILVDVIKCAQRPPPRQPLQMNCSALRRESVEVRSSTRASSETLCAIRGSCWQAGRKVSTADDRMHRCIDIVGSGVLTENTCVRRDNPGREVILRIERNGQAMDLPVVPELAPTDNYGQIGVKLLANAEIRHRWVPCKPHRCSAPHLGQPPTLVSLLARRIVLAAIFTLLRGRQACNRAQGGFPAGEQGVHEALQPGHRRCGIVWGWTIFEDETYVPTTLANLLILHLYRGCRLSLHSTPG